MQFKNKSTGVTVSVADERASEFRTASWEKVTQAAKRSTKSKTTEKKKTNTAPQDTADESKTS